MRLILISDTHEQHEKLGKLPEGDVLVHAGDYTYRGSREAKRKFFGWLLKQPHEYKILIAGNHDFGEPVKSEHLDEKAYYLYESGVTINGIRFWGSPYTPRFGPWAFMYDRPTTRWEGIPHGTDVLVTHGPPLRIFDSPGKWVNGFDGEHVGCFDLATRVGQVRPQIHVFGHIHGSYGMSHGDTRFFNASVVDEAYEVVNPPHVVDL